MKSLKNRLDEHYRANMVEGDDEKDETEKIDEANITSEKQFKEWAETVLKKAHGDNYDQSTADKVISDLAGDVEDGDWGAAVGRLSSGLE